MESADPIYSANKLQCLYMFFLHSHLLLIINQTHGLSLANYMIQINKCYRELLVCTCKQEGMVIDGGVTVFWTGTRSESLYVDIETPS